jgi:hypothetical protein
MVAFVLLGLTACGQLSSSDVDQKRVQLTSTAAEASLLADGAAHAEYTAPFIKVHADELNQDATDAESALADAQVAPPARAKAAKVRQAARILAAAMDRLGGAPEDPDVAARSTAQIKQAKAALDSA